MEGQFSKGIKMKKILICLSSLILSQQAIAEELFIHDVLETDHINIVQAEYSVEHEKNSLNEEESRYLNFNIEKKLMEKLCSNHEYANIFDKTVEVEVFLTNGEAYMIQELKEKCN